MTPPNSFLQPCDEKLFFSRSDPEDPRLGEFVLEDLGPEVATLWGYPDDEGIRLNGGRPGAALAPEAIRMCLYRMTPARSWPRTCLVRDLGDWAISGMGLEDRGELLRQAVASHYRERGSFLVTLGGGHDYGYPDAAGFLDAFAGGDGGRPLVLNFDAHLDMRPLDRGPTSGTPFRRLIETFPGAFDLVEVGLQNHCNSPFHWEWAVQNGASVVGLEEIQQHGLMGSLAEVLEPAPRRPLFLSLDIDCLRSSEAPGCSAPNASGLEVRDLQRLWPWLFANFDVKGLGIYEVSPPLDADNRTSRVAALMIHSSIHERLKRHGSPKP